MLDKWFTTDWHTWELAIRVWFYPADIHYDYDVSSGRLMGASLTIGPFSVGCQISG